MFKRPKTNCIFKVGHKKAFWGVEIWKGGLMGNLFFFFFLLNHHHRPTTTKNSHYKILHIFWWLVFFESSFLPFFYRVGWETNGGWKLWIWGNGRESPILTTTLTLHTLGNLIKRKTITFLVSFLFVYLVLGLGKMGVDEWMNGAQWCSFVLKLKLLSLMYLSTTYSYTTHMTLFTFISSAFLWKNNKCLFMEWYYLRRSRSHDRPYLHSNFKNSFQHKPACLSCLSK